MTTISLSKANFDHPEEFLTPEERLAIKDTFELFDKDGDGCLDERELKKGLEGNASISCWSLTLFSKNLANTQLMKKSLE